MEELQKIVNTNLQLGMVVKNYKELCSLLNLPVLGGKQRTYQLKEIERYIDYVKEGHKYVITEIYESPAEKIDKRKERGVYTKYIQLILMDMLVNHSENKDGYKYIGTKADLLLELGMITNKYRKYNYGFLADLIPGLLDWQIEDYFDWTSKRLNEILSYSLERLDDASLIDCKILKVPYIQENGILTPVELTSDITKEILEIENQVLKKMNLEYKSQVNSRNKWRDFYYYRNQIAKEHGYHKIQELYQIISLDNPMIEKLEKENRELQRLLLNNEICEMLSRTSQTMINTRNKQAEKQLEYLNSQKPKMLFGKRPNIEKEDYGIKYYNDPDEQKKKIQVMINKTIKLE